MMGGRSGPVSELHVSETVRGASRRRRVLLRRLGIAMAPVLPLKIAQPLDWCSDGDRDSRFYGVLS